MQNNVVRLHGKSPAVTRAERDAELATDNGFALSDRLWYRIGTQADAIDDAEGIAIQRNAQVEHDAKPLARDLASALVDRVRGEHRADMSPVKLCNLRMASDGRLVYNDAEGRPTKVRMTGKAFGTMFSRFPCRSAHAYLSSCPTVLRAINFNHWAQAIAEESDRTPRKVVLRTRYAPGESTRNVFAALSPGYTVLDADTIAENLKDAFPRDARGSLDYNGEKWRIEALWRTDIDPSEFQTGEIFKAGVLVKGDDTGSGAIVVQSVIWRQACKNLLITNRAIGHETRLRHRGGTRVLTSKFAAAFDKALCSVKVFADSWNYATAERDDALLDRVRSATATSVPGNPNDALGGIFNGLLERDIISVPGDRKTAIEQLCEMHRQDELASQYGVSRASVINAITRYAHVRISDPFRADELRAQAGTLLANTRGSSPVPLPYISVAA